MFKVLVSISKNDRSFGIMDGWAGWNENNGRAPSDCSSVGEMSRRVVFAL
jgi:hypothetical protein